MIVDDDNDVRWMLKILFEQTGFALVAEAADGLEAIEKVKEIAPDVVLMDILMPNMNGVEATRIIRRDHPDVTILGFTASGAELAQEILRAGAVAVFAKERFPALIDHIREWSAGKVSDDES